MTSQEISPIKMKIAELSEMILAAHPRMPLLLKDIHGLLKSDPDNVTLLSEEEIGIIVSGLKRQTSTELASTVLKKSSKALSKTTVDDL